jgi:protein tyrosine/serine phosphatase
MRTWLIATAVCLMMMAGSTWAAIALRRSHCILDHFDVVAPGILYRSGDLRPEQLRWVVAQYGIKTIVNLQLPTDETEAERGLARELGVDFLNLPMPGDGFGREEQFRMALAAIDDSKRRPVLVHCARGTCRTGATVALYRFERGGWTLDDVTSEMVRQTYRDGHLPGYVYAMTKNRPWTELYYAVAAYDRNQPDDHAGTHADGAESPPVPTLQEGEVADAPDVPEAPGR